MEEQTDKDKEKTPTSTPEHINSSKEVEERKDKPQEAYHTQQGPEQQKKGTEEKDQKTDKPRNNDSSSQETTDQQKSHSEANVPAKKPKKSKFLPVLFIVILVVLMTLLFIWGWLPRQANQKKIDALAKQEPANRVAVLQLKANKEPIELVLPSSAQAWHITPIWARVDGYLLRYLVDIGDYVKEGDLLAEIDTPELDEQVKQAQADLQNAQAQKNIAQITTNRWQGLWNKNKEAVAKQEVDQYASNFTSAEALEQASAKSLARTTYQQQFKYIYAPFTGIITQRNIDIGSLIYGNVNNSPQELFQIAQVQTIRFFVDVPQNYYRQIKEGVEAEVSIQELPGHVFKGVVTRYAKALDPTARTLLTEVDVDNNENLLYAGLFGKVKFLMYPENINFIIPTTALIIHTGKPTVAVVDSENIVHMKHVQIGRDYGKQLEIVGGLQENDRVITIPSDIVKEGAKVDVAPSSPKIEQKGDDKSKEEKK